MEQAVEADVDVSADQTSSCNRAVSMKMYWRPSKALRAAPFVSGGHKLPSNGTEVTVSLGIRIQPRDDAFRRLLYARIKQFVLQESNLEPIGSLDHRLRGYDLAIEFDTLMELRADWPTTFMKRLLIFLIGESEALRRALEELCPPMILTIGDWEPQAMSQIPLTETQVSYPPRIFAILGVSPGSAKKDIDIAKTKMYQKFPPKQYPKIAWYIDDTINKSNQLTKLGNLKSHYLKLLAFAKAQQNLTDELRSEIMATYSAKIRGLESRIKETNCPN
jgi:hypothetical protein